MGVPAFFRWLSRKYPNIIVDAVEEEAKVIDGVEIPVDTSEPNPNKIEFDNLYLDMNNIIHPCTHPEDRDAPETEEEMMELVMEYIDRLFGIVRPRKVLFMAVDGVAPRAKINQQRARRFRAAQEMQKAKAEKEQKLDLLRELGREITPDMEGHSSFDHNAITPGTPFMAKVTRCLQYYIVNRLNTDPGWKSLKVVISDAAVPGEGEHKIMEFIRRSRAQPGYNPNTQHCIYGLDADLIMLGLATHEPHFTILREVVFLPQGTCRLCGQPGHHAEECPMEAKKANGEFDEKSAPQVKKPYQFLHINILREYLAWEFRFMQGRDLERVLDDFVFLCFFVGNDFLPHLPSLEIREGAITTLMELYKKLMPRLGRGYLTEDGEVDLVKVTQFVKQIGAQEDDVFRRRRLNELRQRKRERDQKMSSRRVTQKLMDKIRSEEMEIQDLEPVYGPDWRNNNRNRGGFRGGRGGQRGGRTRGREQPLDKENEDAMKRGRFDFAAAVTSSADNRSAAEKLRASLTGAEPAAKVSAPAPVDPAEEARRKRLNEIEAALQELENGRELEKEREMDIDCGGGIQIDGSDSVRLYEKGWKARYYRTKFDKGLDDEAFMDDIVRAYTEGLVWTFRYYYQGVRSWGWFYPFHYSPFASDFGDMSRWGTFPMELGKPFRPFDQLMGVLPAASGHCLPDCFRDYMSNPQSPILDFYPLDFRLDLNGKRYSWQAVVLLPFIDSDRLLAATDPLQEHLTEEERDRNSFGPNILFARVDHVIGAYVSQFYDIHGAADEARRETIDERRHQLSGEVWPAPQKFRVVPEHALPSPIPGQPDVSSNIVASASYMWPAFPEGHVFKPQLLPNVALPAPQLSEEHLRAQEGRERRRDRRNGLTQDQMNAATEPARRTINRSLGHPGQRFDQQPRDDQGRNRGPGRPPYGGHNELRQHRQGFQQQSHPYDRRNQGSQGGHRGGYGGHGGHGGGYGGHGSHGGYDDRRGAYQGHPGGHSGYGGPHGGRGGHHGGYGPPRGPPQGHAPYGQAPYSAPHPAYPPHAPPQHTRFPPAGAPPMNPMGHGALGAAGLGGAPAGPRYPPQQPYGAPGGNMMGVAPQQQQQQPPPQQGWNANASQQRVTQYRGAIQQLQQQLRTQPWR